MVEFTDKFKEDIKKILAERKALLPCPRCGNDKFGIEDGFFFNFITKSLPMRFIRSEGIPVVIIVCTNCGFISQHAIGTLGLLENKENKDDKLGNKQ